MRVKDSHLAAAIAFAAAFALLAPGVQAQHRGAVDFHGRDFGHFSHGDLTTWHGGHWVNDWHDGRFAR